MSTHAADLVRRIGEVAYTYERDYHGCCQCVLAAIQEGLGLGGADSFKAGTALAGGVARMGSACGALAGGLMGISLAFGRAVLEDTTTSQGYARAMELGMELCRRFEREFGTTQCWDIHKSLFGRSFDLRDPKEREAFVKAGGYGKCPDVAGKAAELAAGINLEAGFSPRDRA